MPPLFGQVSGIAKIGLGIVVLVVALHVFAKEPAEVSHVAAPIHEAQRAPDISTRAARAKPVKIEPKSTRKTYNYLVQQAVYNAPACSWVADLDKLKNLLSAGRTDLAAKMDCLIVPMGTEVTVIDTIGTERKQFVLEKNEQTYELWSSYYAFKNALDRARDQRCKRFDWDCYKEVSAEFHLE